MEIKICEVIKRKRRDMNISQEVLAEKLGITVQAVSKWENALSYPDITMLPLIADFFGITMDGLFFDKADTAETTGETALTALPDDDKLRVVQCIGGRVLAAEECVKDKKIKLIIPELAEKTLNVEIRGGAEINGDISGDLKAEGGVCCGDIGGDVTANGGINCGNIGGDATAEGGINCGNIGGDLTSNAGVNCGKIGGDVTAGGNVHCDRIEGNASAEGDIECKTIGGDAKAGKNIIKKI